MQCLHHAVELGFRERGVEKVREHLALVRGDELLVAREGAVALHQVAHVAAVGRHEHVALLAHDVVDRGHEGGLVGKAVELAGEGDVLLAVEMGEFSG